MPIRGRLLEPRPAGAARRQALRPPAARRPAAPGHACCAGASR